MEYLEGGTLKKTINDTNIVIDEFIASSIINNICNALIELNLKNISHNDLKPDNILLCDKINISRVKLVDFGLAKVMGSAMDIGERGTKL